ncbi:MAG: hypothetical protein KBC83_01550 [Candidatus Moranbacteria bacterium]|nr:hypothetical protein [Candidatus Moranbacteria bacterium]
MPLLVDLGRLQRAGDATLEAFIDSCLIGCSPHLFQLSTTDSYLYPLQLLISDQDETGLHSFWKVSPCNQQSCRRKITAHSCMQAADDDSIDCDLFCAGSSDNVADEGEEEGYTRNMTPSLSFCQGNRQGELASCGILAITLHHRDKDRKKILASVELAIGCSRKNQGTLVIQNHAGLNFTLK